MVDTPVLNFEYEEHADNNLFNFYERGGNSYMVNGAGGERFESSGFNGDLGMIFPVARVQRTGRLEGDLKKSLEKFVDKYRIRFRFDFSVCQLGEQFDKAHRHTGKVLVSIAGADCKAYDISFNEPFL